MENPYAGLEHGQLFEILLWRDAEIKNQKQRVVSVEADLGFYKAENERLLRVMQANSDKAMEAIRVEQDLNAQWQARAEQAERERDEWKSRAHELHRMVSPEVVSAAKALAEGVENHPEGCCLKCRKGLAERDAAREALEEVPEFSPRDDECGTGGICYSCGGLDPQYVWTTRTSYSPENGMRVENIQPGEIGHRPDCKRQRGLGRGK